ncbi:biotin--[acetyl-CoA-carboxylase] ligase [Methylocella silvestris]|uniref:biotin--[acetyl-CoA-carboxylase] ligase n=1 Tax=Methylocella silvestris TaxID=199596 RepID=UPI002477F1BD|nr:biotin--[acetyl-CoA-carboxylase] ligase [Methylocella silvestris]
MSHLARSVEASGFRLSVHGELGSTNDEALARARAGDPGRLWIVAERQTSGRGRLGRSWTSEPGNLFASLLLIDPAPLARAPELGFVASLALAVALGRLLGADPGLKIKWPNDILYKGAKIAGVLLEGVTMDAGVGCVAGIGVNCASHPSDTLYPASDLGAIAGRAISPETVLEALAAEMARWLAVWAQEGGFVLIRAEWLKRAAGVGEQIKVFRGEVATDGVFRGIDAAGRLLLDGAAGEIVIEAADVFLGAQPARLS